MDQQTGSKLGKEYVKAVYYHLAYLTYMQRMSCERPDWMKHKLESKIAGRNINNLRYTDDTTLMAESKEELKSLLMKEKEESEKTGLQLNIQKTKIMASWSHLFMANRCGHNGNSEKLFLGSKITVDGDCHHEFKRCLLLGRKAMTNPDVFSLLKSIVITSNKVYPVKAMVFPVVMYGCETWTIKKA